MHVCVHVHIPERERRQVHFFYSFTLPHSNWYSNNMGLRHSRKVQHVQFPIPERGGTATQLPQWRPEQGFCPCTCGTPSTQSLRWCDCSLRWESMYINSSHLISVMGFALDGSAALYLLTAIPLSLHVYGFSLLLLILIFPSSIFHIWGSNYQILYFLHLKVFFF